jgi:hypothetical protein
MSSSLQPPLFQYSKTTWLQTIIISQTMLTLIFESVLHLHWLNPVNPGPSATAVGCGAVFQAGRWRPLWVAAQCSKQGRWRVADAATELLSFPKLYSRTITPKLTQPLVRICSRQSSRRVRLIISPLSASRLYMKCTIFAILWAIDLQDLLQGSIYFSAFYM